MVLRHFLVVYKQSIGDCEGRVTPAARSPSSDPRRLQTFTHMLQETRASQNDFAEEEQEAFVLSVNLLCLPRAGEGVAKG